MATIKDVAKMAGVSISTVSKFINGGNVNSDKAGAIRAAVRDLDYQVNPYARSLKTQRSRSLGILLPTISAPFYGNIVMSLDKVLREHGYHSMISCYSSNHGLERDKLQFMLNIGLDGLIYVPEDLTAAEFRELTSRRNVPVVQVDRMIEGISTDSVLADNTDAVYRAIGCLVDRGHRRIAIITGPKSVFTANERLVGYLRALPDHSIVYNDSFVISGENVFSTGYQGFFRLMGMANRPTAIFSTNYDITIGLITAARERGLRIPEDIDIFGYDCVEVCRTMTPALPVVHQPDLEIGRIAAMFMIERLEGYTGDVRMTRLKSELII